MHLYIAVPCKTPGCQTSHMLKYLGEKGKISGGSEYWIPYPLIIECPMCNQTHDYCESQSQFYTAEFRSPPPKEFQNKLGGPKGLPPLREN